MKKYLILSLVLICGFSMKVEAGNPDRQGEAGAYELLINPWARSTGLHGMVTANVKGVESLRTNVAGLAYTKSTELVFSRSIYLSGTDVNLNAFGFSQRLGEKGVIGISLMSVDFGEIDITTTDQPEGIGATYKPSFFNIGVAYAHQFSERISGGFTVRLVSERVTSVSATGVAFDAGMQYNTGNFQLGISLRNVGTPLTFRGDGLTFVGFSPPTENDPVTGSQPFTNALRANRYELPSLLNIGIAYDFKFADDLQRITLVANFTSNSFSKDQYGGGLEYALKEQFMLRLGYQYEDGLLDDAERTNVYTGLAAGATVEVPMKKGGDSTIGIDYSYRASDPFSGTHSFGI
ncbi:MAG: PorV/PorQ family protein, partial [Bacteroidota bacterium]